jgi:hypothetical protein
MDPTRPCLGLCIDGPSDASEGLKESLSELVSHQLALPDGYNPLAGCFLRSPATYSTYPWRQAVD